MSAANHPFHIVKPSPWPITSSIAVLMLGIGAVLAMHGVDKLLLLSGGLVLATVLAYWWIDVFKEGDIDKAHNSYVKTGLKIGVLLFILTEIMFFVAFFWSYIHSTVVPSEVNGAIWPPKNIKLLNPLELPYFNTLVLLLSGTTATWAKYSVQNDNRKDAILALSITVFLGVLFTLLQGVEYSHASFSIKDGVYPSNFYIATGFHGLHVIIGTIFLLVCLVRTWKGKMFAGSDISLTAAVWYWNFVDAVWLLLFAIVYLYGYKF